MICGKIIKKCLFVIALLSIIASVPALWWAWKYYQLPEFPDRRNYKTIEERAERAMDFARSHNMNEHYALFVDYGIPSGTPRLFVWDFHQKKIVARWIGVSLAMSAACPFMCWLFVEPPTRSLSFLQR